MYCKKCGKLNPDGSKFCQHCGIEISEPSSVLNSNVEQHTPAKSKSGKGIWIVAIILALIGGSYGTSSLINSTNTTSTTPTEIPTPTLAVERQNQTENTSSVVNIFCNNGYSGSGTIWTTDGLIMTNNHVITGSTYCMVTIPEPTTGSPTSIYTAIPLVYSGLSELYDIAAMEITGSYTDSNRKIWGVYPTTFPAFIKPTTCKDAAPKLGDSIRIYGYPVSSGGYNLTITDGIISSFSDNGDILTSAKVDSGNSGGLAIDQQTGCMVGIPSAIQSGKYQNLGVIIPLNVIADFLQKAIKTLPTDTPVSNR